MKIHSFFALCALAALTLAGCNKKEAEPQVAADPDAGVKAITLSINGIKMTKAQVTPDDSWSEKSAIDQLDIYFTTNSDVIKYSYRLSATENSEAWEVITKTTGANKVRFIGLTGVSRVYVVANSSESLLESGNISQVAADLENMYGNKENTDVLYVGGDEDLSPIGTEPATEVGTDITEGDAEMADQYYSAIVSIRPVISRLEIGKISAVTSGSAKIQGDGDQTWTVNWSGFEPQLTGIYMSNFYGKLNPVAPTLSDFFATPAGNLITNGLWNSNAGIPDRFNESVLGIALYSNYGSEAYQDIFANEPAASEANKYVYFDGNSMTCVPFNFLVPFDVTATVPSVEVPGEMDFEAPKFHFQFVFDTKALQSFKIDSIIDDKTSDEVDPVEDQDLYDQLSAKLVFTTASTEGNIYYANVTGFVADNDGTPGEAVTVKPNSIYRMSEVKITPFNMGGGTVTSDEYNIIVKVTVLDYNPVNVLPSFE